ncbi:MAG: toll/interleukin-1 receptor domain-containing protein [Reyranella sp.]|nr:toll/interleukin-1 receptor domain-containing protein [Reyranella sp.]
MAYIEGYKYDVFISFALNDDYPTASGGKGWVSRFAEDIFFALKTRLGGPPELKVFYSPKDANGGNYVMEGFAKDAKQAALMLSVVSRTYVGMRGANKPVSLQELESFIAANSDKQLFAAQILPFLDEDPAPEVLRKKIAAKFWYETDGGKAATLYPTTPEKTDKYWDRIGDLAEAMCHQLLAMRENGGAKQPVEPPLGTVLLAQVTDDLEEQRESVRRYLSQFNVRILPAADYPADPEKFEAAFAADLEQATMVVQLISAAPGRRPDGYVARQATLATKSSKSVLQWRRPDLVTDNLPEEQKKLLNGPSVLVDRLETFSAAIVAKLQELAKPPPPAAAHVSGEALVFVNADTPDMDIAHALRDAITKYGHVPSLPMMGGTPADARQDLLNNISLCDGLMLVYGQANLLWVRQQLLLYNKVKRSRDEPLRVLAVYIGPPDDKPKLDLVLPGMIQTNAADLPATLARLRN